MHLRAVILGLLMVLLFAPAIQAAAPAEHGRHTATHDIGSQSVDGNLGSPDGDCLPHARAYGSSCCEMACFGCSVAPLGPVLSLSIEPSRLAIRHADVAERLMPSGLDRPPKAG